MKDNATAKIARFVAGTGLPSMPATALHAAKSSILNWFGLVLHAGQHPAVRIVRDWVRAQGGEGATAVGGLATAPLWAALVNGLASHVEDYDDTHSATIIHPTGPVWSAVLAVAEQMDLSGAEALQAFVLGVDVECRVGEAVFPSHYDRGHHITATAGVLGAAAAVAKLLDLDRTQRLRSADRTQRLRSADWRRIEEALGLASTMASGLRGTFGSMTKPFHPGKAAMEGIIAAQLAAGGFTSGNTGLESPLGFCGVLADEHDITRLTEGLGQRWLIEENAIKPFACGVVAHAALWGVHRLRSGIPVDDVVRIDLWAHPRVGQLMGNPAPATGLEGKFSIHHSVAACFLDGRAGPRQYTDERVQAPDARSLRERVMLRLDGALSLDEARVSLVLRNGEERAVHVRPGGGRDPMSDEALVDKVRDLLQDWPPEEVLALQANVLALEEQPIVRGLAEYLAAAPF